MSDYYWNRNLKSWILLSIVTFFSHSTVYGLYSSMPYIEMAVPLDLPTYEPLVVAPTLPAVERPAMQCMLRGFGYFTTPTAATAGVFLTAELRKELSLKNPAHAVTRYCETTSGTPEAVVVNLISIRFIEASECDQLSTQDLCFWRDVRYQVYKNQSATVLGPLGPAYMRKRCPHYSLSYEVRESQDYFSIASDGVSLQSRERLDRDTRPDDSGTLDPGPKLVVHVTCTVDRGRSVRQGATTELRVTVLGDDYDTPTAQINEHFWIWSELKEEIEPDTQNLRLPDMDTHKVNNYDTTLLSDTQKLFDLQCWNEPNYAAKIHTIIHCKVQAKKTTPLPWSPYQMVLRINDTSLKPGYWPSYVDLYVNITEDYTNVTQTAKQYPEHVSVFPDASPYISLAEPEALHELVYSSSAPGYHLETSTAAFRETSSGEINYVSNVIALHNMPDTLKLTVVVAFDKNKTDKVLIRVDVRSEVAEVACKDTTWWQKRTIFDWTLCSEKDENETCGELCGVGTGRTSPVINGIESETGSTDCVWRGIRMPALKDSLTRDYAICNADKGTCPDFLCDPLEEIHFHICPQDCRDTVTGAGYRNEGINSNRGIAIASTKAICTCDPHNKCACAAASSWRGAIPEGLCGAECLAGLVTGSFILVCSIIGLYIFWKYRMCGKSVGSLGCLPCGPLKYVEGALQLGDPATMIVPTDPRTVLDPKWEFPRSRLIINQTLGEGEFGRVLRAYALDIGGVPGCTTVAVKTLKEDASAAELTDLLSEYQLLKEVKHPNVIRLLGACTTPGAPVYLIIEFAEYGSLRNYLRKWKHLLSDSQNPCPFIFTPTTVEVDRTNIPAAPKDILSFAWQISKGMAYLSDSKLVHRDLAARNVLVATGKICKISDFGLTRDVYEDDAYLKRSKGRVPVKWMALESLEDHVYTSKSDVWSFGVLLWEMVTLGASPYPGIAAYDLFHLLNAGYRMQKPKNCSTQLYKVMTSCWNEVPSERPSFKELTMTFEQMLEDGVDYLDLNPYIGHDRTYCASPRDILDNNSEDSGYGNFSVLQNDSIGNMAQPHHQLIHEDTHNDLHGSERFKQPESPSINSQLQGKKDEQHQPENYEKENALLIAKTSISLENHELHQNERAEYNESPKNKQCIPDTHLTTNLSNEHMNAM